MILQALAFYVFAAVAVASGIMVVTARNPVHSVLFLILAFFNAAGLFVLMGAEFLAMILVIVYVGAVAVLFLFVVMMLDIDFVELRQGFVKYLPIGGLIGIVLLVELFIVIGGMVALPEGKAAITEPIARFGAATNTEMLGKLLYTKYVYLFQVAGVILFVAMVGAIVLTLRQREGVRRQSVRRQLSRTRAESVELVKVKPGEGV
jgi:NADH-quinone oxidoreductase subunit J